MAKTKSKGNVSNYEKPAEVKDEASNDRLSNDRFMDIKCNVEEFYNYFERNYYRFNISKRFLYVSTLSIDARKKLALLKKPDITCNVLESQLSQRISAFVKQQPAPSTHSKKSPPQKLLFLKSAKKTLEQFTPQSEDDQAIIAQEIQKIDKKIQEQEAKQNELIKFINDHARDVLSSPQNNQFGRAIYTDTTSGGFAVGELIIDWASDTSLNKEPRFEWVPNPCLCGFAPTAKLKHKGDGDYCYKFTPMTEAEFNRKFDSGKTEKSSKIKYSNKAKVKQVQGSPDASFCDFHWAYYSGTKKMVMIGEYYEKEYRVENLHLLSDETTATDEQYAWMKEKYRRYSMTKVVPEIVRTRKVNKFTIYKYIIYSGGILSCEETDFRILPLVFFDGNSVVVPDVAGDSTYFQECRPYIHNAIGAQRLKDMSLQTAANEIENMSMNKYKMPIESLPNHPALVEAYTKPQESQILFYNEFYNEDPNIKVSGPQEVQRTPTPPIVMEAFYAADRMIQQALSSYDSQPVMDERISGEAVKQLQMQSEQGADPYMQNYILSLNQLLYGYLAALPDAIKTPSSLPMRGKDGKRYFTTVNHDGADGPLKLSYEIEDFNIVLEAGPSNAAQRQLAVAQLKDVSQSFPSIGRYIDQKAGGIVLDQIEMQNSEALQEGYAEDSKKNEAAQEAAAQKNQELEMRMKEAEVAEKEANAMDKKASAMERMANIERNNRAHDLKETEMTAKIMIGAEEAEHNRAMETERLNIAKQDSEAAILSTTADIKLAQEDHKIQHHKIRAENARTLTDSAHRSMELLHKVQTANKAEKEPKSEPETGD